MRSLEELSGPWVGWSVQDARRIHERIEIRFWAGEIGARGEDADGDFTLEGSYDTAGEVVMVRRYTYCVAGPEGVGIPYLYRGRWDGGVISGQWQPLLYPMEGGPFELWPEEADAWTTAALNQETASATR